jgi:hypothetical protein
VVLFRAGPLRSRSRCCLRAGGKGMTDSHFLPSAEDTSIIDLALCGSRDPRTDPLVAWKRFLSSISLPEDAVGGGFCVVTK